jgi:hypothetical protein
MATGQCPLQPQVLVCDYPLDRQSNNHPLGRIVGDPLQWSVSSSDGKQLYYVEANGTFSIVAVPVMERGDELQFGSPQTLISRMNLASLPFYDVSRDGKKILVARLSQQGNQSVTLVTNFAEGLNKEK